MTEHSEPRRWKLATTEMIGREDRLLRAGVDSTFNDEEVVWAREDKATEAEVEAVAKALSEKAYCDIAPSQYYAEARSLLSAIFKEGGEG